MPPLPDDELVTKESMGEYVYTAMRNLSDAGYRFELKDISEMTTPEWSVTIFHTDKPFMKLYEGGPIDTTYKGEPRFKSEIFKFGDYQILVTKEWYPRQLPFFKDWYNKL